MVFIDDMGWSELARLDAPPTMQTLILLLVALVLMPSVMRMFGTLFRLGFILTALLIPVYFVMPLLR
jgi:uncharacterized SAM-binding protein YcdF (DUF218 family)